MMNAGFTELLLAALAVILIWIAWVDSQTYTISNRINLVVAGLALVYWWSIQLPVWPEGAIRIGVAAAVFAVFAIAFYVGMMGGGDVKLAAALSLWFSPHGTLAFIVVMSLAGGLLTLVVAALHKMRRREGRPEVPYGIAIAAGGMWLLAQRFLNHFAG